MYLLLKTNIVLIELLKDRLVQYLIPIAGVQVEVVKLGSLYHVGVYYFRLIDYSNFLFFVWLY